MKSCNRSFDYIIFYSSKLLISGNRGRMSLWDIEKERELMLFPGHIISRQDSNDNVYLSNINHISVLPDKAVFLSSGANEIKLWNVKTGREIYTISEHPRRIATLSFSPNGEFFVSNSDNSLKIWDVQTAKLLQTLASHTDAVTSVSVSPNSRLIASDSNGTLKVWGTPGALDN
jgi:WD40 repeat protein